MPPWEKYGGTTTEDAPPWSKYGGDSSQDKVGIRPASLWEEAKSKLHQLKEDPIGTLTENQFSNAQSVDTGISDFMLGGASTGSGPLAEKIGAAAKAGLTPKAGGRVSNMIEAFKRAGGGVAEVAQAPKSPPPGVDPEVFSKLPEEMQDAIHEQATKKAAGVGYKPAPKTTAAPAPKPQSAPKAAFNTKTASFEKVTPAEPPAFNVRTADFENGPVKTKAPVTATKPAKAPTSRTNRGTPEAQQRSDDIAAGHRHAATIPLAEQAVKDGVTSKQLVALDPAQRADFMKRIGLEGRSDATWRTFIGHVQRLEKSAK